MTRSGFALHRLTVSCAALALLCGLSGTAFAQETDRELLVRLQAAIEEQAQRLDAQQRLIDDQRAELDAQREQLRLLTQTDLAPRSMSAAEMEELRGGQAAQAPPRQAPLQTAATTPAPQQPAQPVGEAPPEKTQPVELAALPDNVSVLTPRGRLVVDPSIEFANFAANRLVFRGVEIVTGLQIGVIEASSVDRNTVIGSLTTRFGLTDRLELEARIPYIHRSDEVTTLAQRDQAITSTFEFEGSDIGDIEITGRYQLTDGRNGKPIWIGNLRYKTDTGRSPFSVERDEFGIARDLPTGSGFWAIEPSLTLLVPSDPAVLFANLGYLYHAPADVDREFNGAFIGNVDPGDSINASLGFGFAVNQRFSFSLGYRHSYIFPTETEIAGVLRKSDDFHSGALQLGWSYLLGKGIVFNNNFEFGATDDAPDVRVLFRLPMTF